MSPISSQTPSLKRIAAACGIVMMSFVVACGAVVGFFFYEISQGNTPNQYRQFRGSLKNGELWFVVSKSSGNPLDPNFDAYITRMNLTTGMVNDAGLPAMKYLPSEPIWIGETLYIDSGGFIQQVVDRTLVELPLVPKMSVPFDYDGNLTIIGLTADGEYQLVHWIDGQWKHGRKILLPEGDRQWRYDGQRDRTTLLPLTSEQADPDPGRANRFILEVLPFQHDYHLVIRAFTGFSAYRKGFEFVDDPSEFASALAPENAAHDVSGWERVFPPEQERHDYHDVACDREGLLFHWWDGTNRVARRLSNGKQIELAFQSPSDWEKRQAVSMFVDPSQPDAHIVAWNDNWSSAIICPIEGQTVRAASLRIPGFERDYVERWLRIIAELLIVWALHVIVLVSGMAAMLRRSNQADFDTGHRRATLAPLTLRTMAGLIDALLLYATVFVVWSSWQACLTGFQSTVTSTTWEDQAEALLRLEQYLRWDNGQFEAVFDEIFRLALSYVFLPVPADSDFFSVMVATLVVFFAAKVRIEGRFRVTPGKWLVGIRTVRSTLRPCGFARSLVRNVLHAVDVAFLLSPVPAAVSQMLSHHGQRIGDRIADTIVIRTNSIRDLPPQ